MPALRRHVSALAAFALVLQLVLSLPAYPGFVLCVGANGHVAVESGGCADESTAAAPRCDELGQSAPCTDTPLAARELVSGSAFRAGDHGAAAALTSPFVAPVAPLVTRLGALALSSPDPSPASRHAVLRL